MLCDVSMVHVHDWGVGGCLYIHLQARSFLLHHALPSSFETRSLTGSGAGLIASKPHDPPASATTVLRSQSHMQPHLAFYLGARI